jgi:hypothetical protein
MAEIAAIPARGRPYQTVLLLLFFVVAVAGIYYMRVIPVINDIPVDFLQTVESSILPNGVPVKKTFIGISVIDEGLSFLVSAFIGGAAGWNKSFFLLQVHFLISIGAQIAVMNVEACRERNRGRWLRL